MHEMDVSIFYSKSIMCKLYIQIKPAQWIKSYANSLVSLMKASDTWKVGLHLELNMMIAWAHVSTSNR